MLAHVGAFLPAGGKDAPQCLVMKRLLRGLMVLAVLCAAVLSAVALALHQWVGSADFRERLAREASAALGVPVALQRLDVAWWPLPAVALEGVSLQTRPAVTLARIEARPAWRALLRGRLQLATLVVRGAVLPREGVLAVLASLSKQKRALPATQGVAADGVPRIEWLPRRVVLDGVTWVGPQGASTTLDADARLDADGLPARLNLTVVQGAWRGAQASLVRADGRWTVQAGLGGGSVSGSLGLQVPGLSGPPGGAGWVLDGQLQTRGVEVAALTAPSRPLSGQLEAETTLSARAREASGLADALNTQTRFTVRNAVLHGLDLARAVTTAGLSRGGETRLDALSGEVATQGRAAQVRQLSARSGVLTASGQVSVSAARALSGRISVDTAGGLVGVPLAVGGTLDAPQLTLTRGALLGAAVGTAVLPGVGTGAGARLGDRIDTGIKKLFDR